MSKQLRGLQSRKATLVKDARALTDFAAAEQRDMNDINDQETFQEWRQYSASARCMNSVESSSRVINGRACWT